MKTAVLIAMAALGLTGCATSHQQPSQAQARPGFAYETTAGRGIGYENDLGPTDPRGAFQQWRFGGTPDRIPPRLPVDPNRPTEPPVAPLPDQQP